MNAMDVLIAAPHITSCLNCGSDKVGGGSGTLIVEDTFIERTCKCGYRFRYNIADGITDEKLKTATLAARDMMKGE